MRWSVVTISLGHGINPKDLEEDALHLKNLVFPDCEEILVVNDASEDVGSGGSALNALIRTAERLCYRNGFAVLTDTVLHNANILIVLVSDVRAVLNIGKNEIIEGGQGYVFDTYLSNAIKNASEVAALANQKGVWIIGSDSFWTLEQKTKILDLPQNGITGFTFTGVKSQYREHGWYRTEENGRVSGMEFDGEVVETDGIEESGREDCQVILGFLYMPFPVSAAFLSLHSQFPVAATTYLGVDSNVTPLKLSIFFDFMLATCTEKEKFISNKLGTKGKVSENIQDRTIAREQIYKKFRDFQGRIENLDIKSFQYKEFPPGLRSYSTLLSRLNTDLLTSDDVERVIRSELSVQKLQTVDKRSTVLEPSSILKRFRDIIEENESPEVHLRMIFTSSLALSVASEGKGGLRNGPAKNPTFASVVTLEREEMKNYLLAMMDEILKNWIDEPSKMIRAARHLETAAQHYIRKVVDSMCLSRTLQLVHNEDNKVIEVKVTAPARIDFFGGWLDTPPIFFSIENAAVVNMSVRLDGKNPITCWVRKIEIPVIEVCQDGIKIAITNEEELFYVHDKPTETGSLVCACILALNFRTLADLFSTLSCTGIQIETKSELPHGSGLGTSSTIASTILRALAVLGTVLNTDKYSLDEMIVHTVLRVEQIMTTGGGWQDQIGSLYPGLKKCYFVKGAGDETRIAVKKLPLSPDVVEWLEKRLLLVYTGKTRLAKHLLQEVIRNFFTCPQTKSKLSDMTYLVDEFGEKLRRKLFPVELVEKYHETKNFMTRCEPPIVTDLLNTLRRDNLIEAGWAAGAGGGGFLYLWLTEDTSSGHVESFLTANKRFSKMTCHTVKIPTVSPFTVEITE